MTDVAVVGASAAGLFAAERLAASGARVTVLERSAALDPVSRTLIATSHLRDVLGPSVERSIRNEIRGFELFADGVVAGVELRRPDLIVERSVLVRDLAERALGAGVELRLGRRFHAAHDTNGAVVVRTTCTESGRHEATECSNLVGADGAFSRVARTAGWPKQTTVPLIQAVVSCPPGSPSDTVRVWFRPDDTQYFYWLIPQGDGLAVIGLIGEERHNVRSALARFLRQKDFEPICYQAARIPLYRAWRPVQKGNVYLVGDAAGHVKSSTVGGLVTGFRGAAGVAASILGQRSPELRSLRRELDLHTLLRRVLGRFGEQEYRRLLRLLSNSERQVLSSYTRDETYRLLWRLCIREPRLATLALAGLVRRPRMRRLGAPSDESQSSAGTFRRSPTRKTPTATSQAISR